MQCVRVRVFESDGYVMGAMCACVCNVCVRVCARAMRVMGAMWVVDADSGDGRQRPAQYVPLSDRCTRHSYGVRH